MPEWGEANKPRVMDFLDLLDRELKDRLFIAGDHYTVRRYHRADRGRFHEAGEARDPRRSRQRPPLVRPGLVAAERDGLTCGSPSIGSGDAFGSGGRFNTCFMVEGDSTFLIDCGASSPVALRARGVDPNTIDGVILSHLHGDHFGGLPFLLLDAQLPSRRERPLTIAGPPGTRERIMAAMEVLFPRSSTMTWRFPLDFVEIKPGETAELLGLTVNTAAVIHHSGAPSTAIRLSDGDRVLAYSGDTEWTDALIPIASGSDLFIVECYEYDRLTTGHMTWGVLKPRFPDFQARQIMVTHMSTTMLERVAEIRGAGALVAEDGMVVEV